MDAAGYFHYLKSYLDTEYYGVFPNMYGVLTLKERISTPDGEVDQDIAINIPGDAFAIKLDTFYSLKKQRPKKVTPAKPLFHFLNDEGKPWSRRCDYVLFHLKKTRIEIHCFEFKYKSIPVDSVISQLDASEKWCRALVSTIEIYTGQKKKPRVYRYVLSSCEEEKAASYLDGENKYLTREPGIRHYFYHEIDNINISNLDHCAYKQIG